MTKYYCPNQDCNSDNVVFLAWVSINEPASITSLGEMPYCMDCEEHVGKLETRSDRTHAPRFDTHYSYKNEKTVWSGKDN